MTILINWFKNILNKISKFFNEDDTEESTEESDKSFLINQLLINNQIAGLSAMAARR